MNPRRPEEGFSLVELLVTMIVLSVLLAVSLVVVRAGSSAARVSTDSQSLTAEARHALNRMSRDLRQASEIVHVTQPLTAGQSATDLDPGAVVAVRFVGDYNGDGCVRDAGQACGSPHDPSNPEDLTYCFAPGSGQLYVIDNVQPADGTPIPKDQPPLTCDGGQPLLAGNVAALLLRPRSGNHWPDTDASGLTDWVELDKSSSLGNGNDLLDVELRHVDALDLEMVVALEGRDQVFRTSVDLRNVGR